MWHSSYFMYHTEFLLFELNHCSLNVQPCAKHLYEALAKQEQKAQERKEMLKKYIPVTKQFTVRLCS